MLGSIGLNLAYNVFKNIEKLDENDVVSSGVLSYSKNKISERI